MIFSRKVKAVLKKIIYTLLIITFACLGVFHYNLSRVDDVILDESSDSLVTLNRSMISDDLSCYFDNKNNVLPIVNESFEPPNSSIFFHETSCQGGLDIRQACDVEAAARLHPNRVGLSPLGGYIYNIHIRADDDDEHDIYTHLVPGSLGHSIPHRQIHLLFSSPVTALALRSTCLAELFGYRNIIMSRINHEDYARGTIVEEVFYQSYSNGSNNALQYISRMLRFITLFKYGGTYLDTDVMTVHNLDVLGNNWFAAESIGVVNDGIMSVSSTGTGHTLMELILQDLNVTFNPKGNPYGPGILTRVLYKRCEDDKPVGPLVIFCAGIKIFRPELMFPLHYTEYEKYFVGKHKLGFEFTHNFWSTLSYNKQIKKNSFYHNLAKHYCPTIYEKYGHEFGN